MEDSNRYAWIDICVSEHVHVRNHISCKDHFEIIWDVTDFFALKNSVHISQQMAILCSEIMSAEIIYISSGLILIFVLNGKWNTLQTQEYLNYIEHAK